MGFGSPPPAEGGKFSPPSIARAMVFAAGKGERLGPLTTRRAKPALPLCGVPLLTRVFRWLAAGGIEEVVVNLHHRPETLEPLLRGAERGQGLPALRIHRSPEPTLLGTSGGLSQARPRLVAGGAGSGPILVLNGDTLPTFRLREMAAFHRRSGGEATLVADPDPGPEFAGERRLVVGRDGVIAGLSAPGGPGFGFAGVWLLEPRALRHLSGRPGGLSGDLLPGLIAAGTGRAFVSRDPWFEIGTPRRYLLASLGALENGSLGGDAQRPADEVRIAPGARAAPRELVAAGCVLGGGARVARSLLLEGVRIGAGAVVRDSVVAPGEVVPRGARVERALFSAGSSGPL